MNAYDQLMTTTNHILESIDDRLREINKEIAVLERAREALDAGSAKRPARIAAKKDGRSTSRTR